MKTLLKLLVAALTLLAANPRLHAQGTAFTYQGQLNANGSTANGLYDFRFMVWDALTNGSMVAGPLTNSATAVTNGLFTVALDFGPGVFTGPARWLELDVRTNGNGAFTTLVPLQQLLPMPYSIMANTASNLLGPLPAAQIVGNMTLAQLPPAVVTNGTTGVTLTGAFTGNGAGLTNLPSTGGGLTWQNVTGTSQQAQPNTGYLANNSAKVTITLPTGPNLGDIVRVSGIGAGGWIIAQNAGQSVLGGGLPGFMIAATWTAITTGTNLWGSIACSADGTKVVALVRNITGTSVGQIYTSTNSGVTWTVQTNNLYWSSVASSADGTKLTAATNPGYIYTSTNSGVTWTANNSTSNSWVSVASSADGTKLVAAADPGTVNGHIVGGYMYTSTNSGVTWTANNSTSNSWASVASSADGTKLVATAVDLNNAYTSSNSGVTWGRAGGFNSPSGSLFSVASSADGTKLVVASGVGEIYTTSDSGGAWSSSYSDCYMGVASSADGTKLVVVGGGDLDRAAHPAIRALLGRRLLPLLHLIALRSPHRRMELNSSRPQQWGNFTPPRLAAPSERRVICRAFETRRLNCNTSATVSLYR